MKYIKALMLIILTACVTNTSYGQFYYGGRGSASLKWYQIKSDKYKLLYPDYFQPTAIRIAGLLDSVAPYIGYGMPKRLIRTPIILYTEDQLSNGMVTWAPKRDEMTVTPPTANTSTPWLKQLAIHEWRHVVQMSAMKTGLTKVATFLFGEAGIGIGLLVISDWQLEGDATNAETQFSEFGRGLQPDFTLEYRAMAAQPNFLKLKTDRLICGSYNMHIPDIYKYGYQVMTAAETYIKPTIWGEVFDYSAKWPILIIPDHVYLKRHYNTSIKKITKRAFSELDSIWQPYEAGSNNFATITPQNPKAYTTYEYPVILPEGSVLATLTDFDNPTRLAVVDTAGVIHKRRFIGGISSRPVSRGNKLYWTEYKPHPIYEKKNFSIIRSYDLTTGDRQRIENWQSNYFVTPTATGFATVANDKLANGYIRFFDSNFGRQAEYHFAEPTTLHGLAWDSLSNQLCFIAVDERGMWIGALDQAMKITVLKAPSAVTLSDLRSDNGTLYFGSIQSGKDEIHALDIASEQEHRLTTSQFGTTQPTVKDSMMYMRTYTKDGWMLAQQTIDTASASRVEYSRLPENILNPVRAKWQVPNADTIPMNDTVTTHKVKRYSKFGRQFNFHSWLPIAFNWNAFEQERQLRLGFGATGFFQSTLSDMYGSVALGAMGGKFWGVGNFTYTGLPVEFSVNAEYGGGNQLVYLPSGTPSENRPTLNVQPYFTVGGTVSVPFNFTGGHSFRTLQPSFSVVHYNAKLYDDRQSSWDNGLQRWDASLWWSSVRRSAYRNIAPRLGYALRVGVAGAFDNRFSMLYTLWGKGYLPGVMKNHSITLAAGAQYQKRGDYNFGSKIIRPRGVIDNYGAQSYFGTSIDYTFPLAYPDWGWEGVLYFKRIYLNLFGDFSTGRYFTTNGGLKTLQNYSYGVDLCVDFNLIRSFEQGISFSFAFPNSDELYFSVGYNFKF